jgi:hypothetical protein
MAQKTVKLFPAEIDALDRLKTSVRKKYGAKASREDIVGAMAHGVTEDQLVGMLFEYQKHDEWGVPSDDEDAE